MALNKLKQSIKIDKIEDIQFSISYKLSFDSFYKLLRWADSKVWFYNYESIYKFTERENTKGSSSSCIWNLFDVHDESYDWIDNINLESIQLRNSSSIDKYMELEQSIMSSKFNQASNIINTLNPKLIDPDLIKKIEDFFDNRWRDCVNMDDTNIVKFFSSNKWAEKFIQLIDENEYHIKNSSRIIFDWDNIFTGKNNFSISNILISLWILSHTNVPEFIHPKNTIKYIEEFLNSMISDFSTGEIGISDQFNELIPDSHKKLFVVLLSDMLLNSDLLKKLKDNFADNWSFDFLDLTTEMINNLYVGKKVFSKEEISSISSNTNELVNLIIESQTNLISKTLSKFPLLSLIDYSWKNIIYLNKISGKGDILDVLKWPFIHKTLEEDEEYINDYIDAIQRSYDHIELDNFQRWILNRKSGVVKSTSGCSKSYIVLQDTSENPTYKQVELTDNNFVIIKTLEIDELGNLNTIDNKFKYIKIKINWDSLTVWENLLDWEFIDDEKYVKLKDWKKFLRAVIWL